MPIPPGVAGAVSSPRPSTCRAEHVGRETHGDTCLGWFAPLTYKLKPFSRTSREILSSSLLLIRRSSLHDITTTCAADSKEPVFLLKQSEIFLVLRVDARLRPWRLRMRETSHVVRRSTWLAWQRASRQACQERTTGGYTSPSRSRGAAEGLPHVLLEAYRKGSRGFSSPRRPTMRQRQLCEGKPSGKPPVGGLAH